ncbi:MAG: hypothetical protein AB8F78_19520 [Saprospiraceae bacterium]
MRNAYAVGDWIFFSWEDRKVEGELAFHAGKLHPCSYAEIVRFSGDLAEVSTIFNQRIKVYSSGILRRLPAPIVIVGDSVTVLSGSAKGKSAKVESVGWHHKDQDYFYHVTVDGKRKSKRYLTSDLKKE